MPKTESKPRPALARASEAAKFLNISRPQIYKLINSGDVPVRRIGTCLRIPWDWLEAQAHVTTDAGSSDRS